MIVIFLSKRNRPKSDTRITLVSDEDADLAQLSCFCIGTNGKYAGFVTGHGRANQKIRYIHRIVMERILGRPLEKNELVDHINGNRYDNQRDNLRVATARQNVMNRKVGKNNTTGYKGVTWNKRRQMFRADIKFEGHSRTIGYFDTALEAHEAYCEKAKELFGEFWSNGR